MQNTTATMDAKGAAAPATPEVSSLSVTDVAKGVVLYLALYVVQRAEAAYNWLRGRPKNDHDDW